MIQRALCVRTAVEDYVKSPLAALITHFILLVEEWQQLEYLCDLLALFYIMTATLLKLDGSAVH